MTRYELMSVICHHGSSGSGGHYTCYALNSPTDQWYHYDDHSVTKVSPQAVKNSQAYVLFYRFVVTVSIVRLIEHTFYFIILNALYA